ncbi:MAG: NYN domain-containing protein [Acidobacteriia bacterium]|nr:NYN domain-containing protein [Terriglobia bacterium]
MRIRVFVDYWNFQLSLNHKDADGRFKVDWRGLGPWLAKKAAEVVGCPSYTFDGVIIYASYNQQTDEGRKFNNWATTWLDRQPGINVRCLVRKPKSLPRCPSCYKEIADCPHCNVSIAATVEKGVDTLIATDLIRLAWENAYDIAVIASSDSDLVPAVEFIVQKGLKIVQAGFPPIGVDLATASWASFDVGRIRDEIKRP